jgi:hypothetical protein
MQRREKALSLAIRPVEALGNTSRHLGGRQLRLSRSDLSRKHLSHLGEEVRRPLDAPGARPARDLPPVLLLDGTHDFSLAPGVWLNARSAREVLG